MLTPNSFLCYLVATPQHIEFSVVKDELMAIPGVMDVHNLRIWSLTTTRLTMSVHLAIEDINKSLDITQKAARTLNTRFDVKDPTIQIELYSREMEDCDHCQDPVTH